METMVCLLRVPQNLYSPRPLGFCIELLTFCGLNNKRKGIFRMLMFLVTVGWQEKYYGGVCKQGGRRGSCWSFLFLLVHDQTLFLVLSPPDSPTSPVSPPEPSPTAIGGTALDADAQLSLLFRGKQAGSRALLLAGYGGCAIFSITYF